MKDIVKSVVKNGLLMFAVGVALAAISPAIATVLNGSGLTELVGLSKDVITDTAAKHTMLWTGAFFGGFGAIHAALTPIFDRVMGKTEEKAEIAKSKAPEKSPQIVRQVQFEVEVAPQAECCATHCDQVTARRTISAAQQSQNL